MCLSSSQVIIGYVGTAGIVVCIITFAYFVAYDPEDDPFHNTRNDVGVHAAAPSQHEANPVDVILFKMFHKRYRISIARGRGQNAGLRPAAKEACWKEATKKVRKQRARTPYHDSFAHV